MTERIKPVEIYEADIAEKARIVFAVRVLFRETYAQYGNEGVMARAMDTLQKSGFVGETGELNISAEWWDVINADLNTL